MAKHASHDPRPLSQIAIIDQATIELIASQIPAGGYTHPATHPATIIEGDATHRFITDTERIAWNQAEANNITNINATDLTDGGETTLHTHPASVAVMPTAWGKYF